MPPLLGTGQGWGNALLVPAGLIAVVLPVREAVAATAAATVLTPVYGAVLGLPALTLLYEVTGIPLAAFSGYVTVWLFHVVQELREARAELASPRWGRSGSASPATCTTSSATASRRSRCAPRSPSGSWSATAGGSARS